MNEMEYYNETNSKGNKFLERIPCQMLLLVFEAKPLQIKRVYHGTGSV